MSHEDRIMIHYAMIYEIDTAERGLSDEDRMKVRGATRPAVNMAALKEISTSIYHLYSVLDYCSYEREFIDELASIEEMRETALDALRRLKDRHHAAKVERYESVTDALARERQKICAQIDSIIDRINEIIK